MIIRTPRDLGALIKQERITAGLDQQSLATRAGVSRLWINEVEQGKPGASMGRILKTLRALGIELKPQFLHEGEENAAGRRRNTAELIQRVLSRDNADDE